MEKGKQSGEVKLVRFTARGLWQRVAVVGLQVR